MKIEYRMTVLCAAGLLAACATGPYQARRVDNPLEQTSKVVLMDRGLRNDVSAAAMWTERLENGLLGADVQIKNESSKPLAVQFKVKFKDANGSFIDETTWMPEVITQHEIHTLKVTALKKEAQDFVVLVKYGD